MMSQTANGHTKKGEKRRANRSGIHDGADLRVCENSRIDAVVCEHARKAVLIQIEAATDVERAWVLNVEGSAN
jgi:hypothetical protein